MIWNKKLIALDDRNLAVASDIIEALVSCLATKASSPTEDSSSVSI